MGNIIEEKMKSADIMVIDNSDKNFEILSDILLKKADMGDSLKRGCHCS